MFGYKIKLNYPHHCDWFAKLSAIGMDSIALHEMNVSDKLLEI